MLIDKQQNSNSNLRTLLDKPYLQNPDTNRKWYKRHQWHGMLRLGLSNYKEHNLIALAGRSASSIEETQSHLEGRRL